MSGLGTLKGLSLETVSLELANDGSLHIQGTITLPKPTEAIGPYLDHVHKAVVADGRKEYRVDVTRLTFVNSSAIRLFVDWVIRLEDEGKPYQIVFVTDPSRIWQRTAFRSIMTLTDDCARIES